MPYQAVVVKAPHGLGRELIGRVFHGISRKEISELIRFAMTQLYGHLDTRLEVTDVL